MAGSIDPSCLERCSAGGVAFVAGEVSRGNIKAAIYAEVLQSKVLFLLACMIFKIHHLFVKDQ